MKPDDPVLKLGTNAHIRQDLERLLQDARDGFAKRDIRKAADALTSAVLTAHQHGLHREAAVFRKASVILSSGGRPKLLTRTVAPADDALSDRTDS